MRKPRDGRHDNQEVAAKRAEKMSLVACFIVADIPSQLAFVAMEFPSVATAFPVIPPEFVSIAFDLSSIAADLFSILRDLCG